ncbi:transmembrane protein 6/97 [Cladorrhinum sp. PSN332]|nr:transmembrane protein 6/97 [Cladorrhinum sp. PSN332]
MAAVYNNSWRNNIWLGWFYVQLPIILLVDLLEFIYPATLYRPEGSTLHFFWKVKQWYIQTYNDPVVQWSPETASGHDSWMGLFLHFELLFLLPTTMWGLYRLGVQQKGTRGTDELLFFVYALEMAFTTLVCIHDTWYWDSNLYTESMKATLRWQFYAPFVVVPLIGAYDMGSRLVARLDAADEAAEGKKTL